MRPYTPQIDTMVAQQVIDLAVSVMVNHGIPSDRGGIMQNVLAAWAATTERLVYANMKDNFRDMVGVFLEDNSSMISHNERYRQALRATLQSASTLVSTPDKLSLDIQSVAAHEEDAVNAIFREVSANIVAKAQQDGLKQRGSVNRFLASQHLLYAMVVNALESAALEGGVAMPNINQASEMEAPSKEKPIVTYTDQEKPYAEFIGRLEQAAAQQLSTQDVQALTARAAVSDRDACLALLGYAGYGGSEDEIASTMYGASVIVSKREAPSTDTTGEVLEEVSADQTPQPVENTQPVREINVIPEDLSPEEALAVIRSTTGLTDEFLSSFLGVTRPTVKNMALGKARAKITDEGRKKLADHVQGMIFDMTRARDALMLGL